MTCIILHNNQLKWTPSLLSFSEVFLQCTMFWHFSNVLPVFFWRKKIYLFIYLFIYNNYITIQSDHLEFHVHTGLNVMGMTLGQIWPEKTCPFMKISPCGNPITLKILSSCSWWYGLLVLISSWRQWNIGSHVNNSAKIHPIAHISGESVQWKELDGITTCAISSPCMIPRHMYL